MQCTMYAVIDVVDKVTLSGLTSIYEAEVLCDDLFVN